MKRGFFFLGTKEERRGFWEQRKRGGVFGNKGRFFGNKGRACFFF